MSFAVAGRVPRVQRPMEAAVRFVSFALMVAGVAACGGMGTGGGGGDPLVLGLAVPLTDTEGKPDVYGVRSRMGAELAVEELNARDAFGGRKLALRLVNDRGDPETAIAVADSLVQDQAVLAVVGHVYSGATIQAAGRYEGHLPAVATSATSPEISRLGDWIFRVASSDSANAVALARAAQGMGRRIAVLYANDDYGQGLARNFASALRAAGGEVAAMDPFLDATADFRPYLLRMKARGVDLVFVAGLQDPAARAIAQAQQVGLAARFVGGDGIEGLASMGARYDGTAVGILFHPQMSDSARAFVARYRARYREDPDSQSALAYDAVRLLARALEAGHRDPEAIRGWLAGVGRDGRGGSPAFEGVAGSVKFDEHGDPVDKRFTMGVIQGGTIALPEAGR
ncbi:MAG TPA: branched-chain amino acid ABC transporter substrate-binding protein [Longimicrobium sp.]|nr:branched-chain amino acid ABC transporter substrate-binding protein [Longimicrobium sp.]